jgi:Icc-related predicted phosphoesterase
MKTIRILAIADLHDRYERLRSLREEGLMDDVDLIAVCGDLHDGRSKEAAEQSVEALSELANAIKAGKAGNATNVAKAGQPVLIVPGNTDPGARQRIYGRVRGFRCCTARLRQ